MPLCNVKSLCTVHYEIVGIGFAVAGVKERCRGYPYVSREGLFGRRFQSKSRLGEFMADNDQNQRRRAAPSAATGCWAAPV
jgi:hypothetical protein